MNQLQVDEVLPEDFARAGQGFWLDLAIFTLVSPPESFLGISSWRFSQTP